MSSLKYFIYCRKSSEQEDRQILSIPAQKEELRNIAKIDNLTIVDVLHEEKSAHKIGRTVFNSMLERITKGEAQGIIVWDETRIARNSLDGGKVIYMMDLKQIIEIRKPGRVYMDKPDDKAWLSMSFTFSKKESDDKSVNVRRGLNQKAESGWLPSGAKPGYMNDKYAEKGNKKIMNDPDRFPLVKKAWELMLTGCYNPPEILEKLNNEWGYRTPQHKKIGGKPMQRSSIYLIFTDPFYYGEFEYPIGSGKWRKGNHNPMITREEFDRVQVLLGRKGKPRPKTHQFPFTGLISCGECGCAITAEEKNQIICTECKNKFSYLNKDACPKCTTLIEEMKNPKILHYIYYHCTKRKNPYCTQGSVKTGDLEGQVDALLGKIEIAEEFKDWAIKQLNKMNSQEVETRNAGLSNLQKAYDDCVKRIDNLVAIMISPLNKDGALLSEEEFKDRKRMLMNEKDSLEQKLNGTGERINKWVELTEKTFNFARYARYWFREGDITTKKAILSTIGSNLKLSDKLLSLDLLKPLDYISEAKIGMDEFLERLEPNKKTDRTVQTAEFCDRNPAMLPRQDSNLRP